VAVTVYTISTTASDLSGGADFSRELLQSGATSGTLSISTATNTTETSYGFTEAGDPGVLGSSTGTFTILWRITSGNNNLQGSISLSRVNSSGAVQATSTATAEQQLSAGTKTFTITNPSLGTWAAGDRLRVNYIHRNSNTMSAQSITMGFGTSSDTVDTPFSELVELAAAPAVTATAVVDLTVTGPPLAYPVGVSSFSVASRAVTGDYDILFAANNVQELAATAAAVVTATAALTRTANLAAAPAAVAIGTAALTRTANLAAAASAAATTTATITRIVNLAAAPAATATATAALTRVANLAAAPASLASVTASATITKPLAAIPAVFATATAATSVTKPLAAAPAGIADLDASLFTAADNALAALAQALSTGTGVLSIAKPLAASGGAQATATADLLRIVPLAATPAGQATATAALARTANLAAAPAAISTAVANLTRAANLAAAPIASASLTGDLTLSFGFGASAVSQATATASLSRTANLSTSAVSQATLTASAVGDKSLAASLVTQATSTGALETSLNLAANAQAVASFVATPSVVRYFVGVSSFAVSARPLSGFIDFVSPGPLVRIFVEPSFVAELFVGAALRAAANSNFALTGDVETFPAVRPESDPEIICALEEPRTVFAPVEQRWIIVPWQERRKDLYEDAPIVVGPRRRAC
jgi:hypothetical protein